MTEKTVSADDNFTELVNEQTSREVYDSETSEGFEFQVVSGDVWVGHSKNQLQNFKLRKEGREGIIRPKGEPIYAATPGDTDATVDIRIADFGISIHAPLTIPGVDNISTVNDIDRVLSQSDLSSTEVVATGLDISGAGTRSRTLDLEGRDNSAVYADADSSTPFYLDASPDGNYWITGINPTPDAGAWDGTASFVRWEGFNSFRYLRLRMDDTGVSGETGDLIIQGGR